MSFDVAGRTIPVALPLALREAAVRTPPHLALVLGSGLSVLAQRIHAEVSCPFADLPGLAAPTVPYHRGAITLGDWAGQRILVFEGRLHYYEGHPWERVELLPALADALGAGQIILTNAAGGIHPALAPGSILAIRDHIEWNRPYGWRAPVRSAPYSPRLLGLLNEVAETNGHRVLQGIYASVTGPSYETPAEIRALQICGADAVGMSTTREALKAHSLGMECAALSCITNRAAGLCDGPITHEEVAVTAAAAGERFANLLEAFVHQLASSESLNL
jgi:purine-nucleoside phosphorylase